MTRLLVRHIKALVGTHTADKKRLHGAEMASLPQQTDAYLCAENGIITDIGAMSACPERADVVVDAHGGWVLPTFCDSHTHTVFAATREAEFEMRIKGATYAEIAEKGGGILNSAQKMQQIDEGRLYDQSLKRVAEACRLGTAALEIKSGYGLTLESELKMLRVVRRLKETTNMTIKATFLGAHAVPMAYRDNRAAYVRHLIDDMLPRVAEAGLADYIDVFCEKMAFSIEETDAILTAGAHYGLLPKIHTNQFFSLGGIETAIAHNALSVDHLEVMTPAEIQALAQSQTLATLLPTAPFFLNDPHTPPARALLEANVAVALATDFNPGTTPSVSMPFVWSLACIRLKMTPEEALNALTLNGAAAMQVADTLGSLAIGKKASFIITEPVPSLAYFPYAFGSNWISKVFINGALAS